MAECGAGPLEEGGYQYDYIEEPPESLQCPICIFPCREPHIVSCCGKKYCKSCIDRVEFARQPCPLCRGYEFKTLIDKDHERRILALKVYCNYREGGCEWQGEVRHIERHIRGECHYVPVSCKYKCGYECIRRDIRLHEEDVCDSRPLELKLIKQLETLDRKVNVLVERCTNQDNLIKEQGETIRQQAELLKEQKEAFETQQGVIAANKEEVEKATAGIKEREDAMNEKINQVEDSLRLYKEEQQKQHETLLNLIKEPEERLGNKFKENTELFDKTNKELEEKIAAQKETLENLQKATDDIKAGLENRITTMNDAIQTQIQESNKKIITRFDNHKDDSEAKLDNLKETQKKDFETRLEEIKSALKKDVNTSENDVRKELQVIGQRLTEAKNNFVLKTHYDKHMESMRKMSLGFRIPEWQRPLPLTTFSNVPPCQFTMMHFTRHKEEGKAWYSPPFYSEPGGYKLCLRIDPNGMLEGKESHLSVWVYVMKGRFDDSLKWPFTGKITVQLLNWRADRGHIQNIVSFDDAAGEKVRARVTSGKYAATGRGSSKFVPHAMLAYNPEKNTDFCTDGCLCFKISKVELH